MSTACFYPDQTEEVVDFLIEQGIQTLEIFLNTHSELDSGYIQDLARRMNRGGAKLISLHPYISGLESFLFFSNYERRFQDGLDYYKQFFEVCAELGGSYVVFHGERKDGNCGEDRGFERFGILFRTARERGITLLQENVVRCKSGDPLYIERMRRYLGNEVAFVLDLKQCRRANCSIEKMRRAMGSRLFHIHLSDSSRKGDCLLPGEGELNLLEFTHDLLAENYQGAMVLELYRNNFQNGGQLVRGYRYMEALVRCAQDKCKK